MQKITILIHCKDQKSIIASVTNYIASIEGNIIYLDQHVDADENVFFMRSPNSQALTSWLLEVHSANLPWCLSRAACLKRRARAT